MLRPDGNAAIARASRHSRAGAGATARRSDGVPLTDVQRTFRPRALPNSCTRASNNGRARPTHESAIPSLSAAVAPLAQPSRASRSVACDMAARYTLERKSSARAAGALLRMQRGLHAPRSRVCTPTVARRRPTAVVSRQPAVFLAGHARRATAPQSNIQWRAARATARRATRRATARESAADARRALQSARPAARVLITEFTSALN